MKKKTRAQLDRDINQVLDRRAAKKGRRAHSTVASGDSWDVAMDALMEYNVPLASTVANNIKSDQGLRTMTPAFSKALAKVPAKVRSAFESATGMVSKKSYDWEAFRDGAAFGFWASPYMAEIENLAEDDERREAYRELSPGPGGNWEDVMPPTPPAAFAVARKFAKAVKSALTDGQLSDIAEHFSPRDAGYYGAMQSQGEGVGWHDEGVKVDPPRGFGETPQISNAVYRAVNRALREASYPPL